ncbi:MAG: nucleoside hydrolase [Nitrososphaerales archaeon]
MKVIFDMDPGIDDAIALLIALNNPKLNVLAVTTVSGNVDVDKSTRNALRIIDAMGKNTVVARGASKPLFKRAIHAEHVHGRDGLGNSNIPRPKSNPSKLGAQKLFQDLIKTHKKKELSIIATAPLTNIALLLDTEPSVANRLDKIVLMGGVYGVAKNARGNITPFAEFNFYCDPEAANMVLSSGAKIEASGLDVTMNPKCAVDKGALDTIRKLKGKAASITSRILTYPISRYKIFHLLDVFAVACLLQPKMFKIIDCMVRVDRFGKFRGRCVTTLKKGNVKVCSGVDQQKFVQFVLQGVRQH